VTTKITEYSSTLQQEDFWTKRKEVGEVLKNAIDAQISPTSARCRGVQVLKIELVDQKEKTLVDNQVTF
jgi:hypothetical protein